VHWIDVFTRKELKHVVIDSLKYCQQNKGLLIHAWVLMHSHLHMIISSDKEPLKGILRDFKKHTSKQIVRTIEEINESRKEWLFRAFAKAAQDIHRVKNYKVWQDGNKPILLQTNEMLEERLLYIDQNPVEAELVAQPEYYWYISARDYAGRKGLLELSMLRKVEGGAANARQRKGDIYSTLEFNSIKSEKGLFCFLL
jgi:putative transposase